MPKETTEEEILEILERLPEGTREIFFSEKTADEIDRVCKKYNVAAEKISEVSKYVGYVLLGILPTEIFTESLEEVGLKKDVAKNIAQGIRLSIFSQVESIVKNPSLETEKMPAAKESKKPSAEDVYREQV